MLISKYLKQFIDKISIILLNSKNLKVVFEIFFLQIKK